MASKTAGAAEKLNGGSGKMEDMTVMTDEAVKKWKTIGKEDVGCGEEVEDYRQRRRRMRRRGRRMSATNLRQCRRSSGQGLRNFCASGRRANGLKTNCLEWQKTRRRPRFLPKNAAKMKKKRTERIDFTNNRITLHIINIGANINQYRCAYKRNKQNFKFLALYQQTASTNKETENN